MNAKGSLKARIMFKTVLILKYFDKINPIVHYTRSINKLFLQ